MTIEDLKTKFDYNYWANEKFFNVVTTLSEEAFTQTIGGSYGSVRTTLVHILSAEWGWLDRCGGHARPKINAEDFSSAQELIDTWREVESYMRAFLDTLQDEDLNNTIEYAGKGRAARKMPLGELLQHTANHGVHHRGQLALLLRMLGHPPGNIDILFYFAEQRDVQAW